MPAQLSAIVLLSHKWSSVIQCSVLLRYSRIIWLRPIYQILKRGPQRLAHGDFEVTGSIWEGLGEEGEVPSSLLLAALNIAPIAVHWLAIAVDIIFDVGLSP
jgi:hypothetical protein